MPSGTSEAMPRAMRPRDLGRISANVGGPQLYLGGWDAHHGSMIETRCSTDSTLDHGVHSLRRPNGLTRICPLAALRFMSAQPISLPGVMYGLRRVNRIGDITSQPRNALGMTSHNSKPLTTRRTKSAMASRPLPTR